MLSKSKILIDNIWHSRSFLNKISNYLFISNTDIEEEENATNTKAMPTISLANIREMQNHSR